MTIPAQVVSATAWLSAQPWADPKSVSILGFSLGALAAPAIENVAEHDGQPIGWTILAYGGDPFGALVAANPHLKPHFLRPILAPLVNILLSPLEPAKNLPRLSGEFLVLQGSDDSLIPSDARARFRDAVPEPKTVTTFDGDHMGVDPDKLGLLQQIIGASKLWLIDKGAIAPF
jgi:dienelactone hydrolase